MNAAPVESKSIEAKIVDCCQEIYSATDPDIALALWEKMRTLMSEKTQTENRQYIRESRWQHCTPMNTTSETSGHL